MKVLFSAVLVSVAVLARADDIEPAVNTSSVAPPGRQRAGRQRAGSEHAPRATCNARLQDYNGRQASSGSKIQLSR